ncbi:MAG: hypothetical protein ACPGGK_01940 [Pikeienuella sp.]
MKNTVFVLAAMIAMIGAASAEWVAVEVRAEDYPPEILVETRSLAPDGAPDALVNVGSGNIAAVSYAAPTERYAHGIMGDAVEHGSLVAVLRDGKRAALDLPSDQVFEDRYPRLADLDGDGSDEIIGILSSKTEGAAVAVYELEDSLLVSTAVSEPIGRSFRWLNIAGIARFLPGEGKQIAFVRTPHIGGSLVLARYEGGRFTEIAWLYGFSNHAIGSRELRLSAVLDIDGDGIKELALPSASRRQLKIVGFAGRDAKLIAEVELPAVIDKAIAIEEGTLVVGLSDGSVWQVTQQ